METKTDHERSLAIIDIMAKITSRTQATWEEHLELQKMLKFLLDRLNKLSEMEKSVAK